MRFIWASTMSNSASVKPKSLFQKPRRLVPSSKLLRNHARRMWLDVILLRFDVFQPYSLGRIKKEKERKGEKKQLVTVPDCQILRTIHGRLRIGTSSREGCLF